MSADRSLERRLEKLAAAGASAKSGRQLRSFGAGTLLPRILSEIDETIMPRRLTFETDRGRMAVFTVSNARIQQIDSAVGAGPLAGEPLDAADASQLDQLKSIFTNLLQGAGLVSIASEAADGGGLSAQSGPTARALAEAWDIRIELSADVEAAALMDDFLSRTQNAVVAWHVPGGDGGDGAGAPEHLEHLHAVAESAPPPATGATWSLIAVRRAPASDDMTVTVRHGDTRLFLTVSRANLTSVADAWRATVTG